MRHKNTGGLSVENRVKRQCVNDDACNGDWAEAKEAKTQGEYGPEYHYWPVNDDTAQQQYHAYRGLSRNNPANTKESDKRKDDLC